MRDIINATIGTDHFLKCDTYALARNGEGLTPCLSISIPEGLLEYWAYIDFKKANGETFKTPRLEYSEGKIVYDIDGSVLDVEGKLEVQVVFQNANNEIWKTYVKEFAVRYSINATDDIPNKQDFITEAQKLLDELDVGDKVDKVTRESATSTTSYNHKDGSVPYLYGVYGDKNNGFEEKQGLIKGSTGIMCETLAEQLEESNPELAEQVRNGVVTDARGYLDEYTIVVRDGNCSIPCGFHSVDKDEDGNIIDGVLYYGAAVPKPYLYHYVQHFAQRFNGNIRNGTGSSSLQQIQDRKYTGVAIVTKNPNAAALDSTLTDNEPIGATGEFATAFGGNTSAQGKRAMAQGTNTVAKGKYSFATGDNSVTLGNDSLAHGNTTTTVGMASTAGGFNTVSQGDYSDAGGHSTKATGKASVSRGYMTVASGDYSFVTGANTIASGENQTVVGQFNIEDENALFIVGNGTNGANRRNAFVVYKDGSIKIGNTTVTEPQLKKLLELIG